MMTTDKILAWHFLPEDGCMRWGTKELVAAGKTYRVEGPLTMCRHGLHASRRALDALGYGAGPLICRVELWGDVQEDQDKCVARNRHVVWLADASRPLHLFACQCADGVLGNIPKKRRPVYREAIAAKRRWLDGGCSDKELDAARAAADAEADAEASSAAYWAAYAASSAARSAAYWAARSAAREHQNDMLTAALSELAP